MEKYCSRNPEPLNKQKNHIRYNKLYDMDRKYVKDIEGYSVREMIQYDNNIKLDKRRNDRLKAFLINLSLELLKTNKHYTKYCMTFVKQQTLSITFNEFNGYIVQYNGNTYETFNFLSPFYLKKIFNEDI